MATDSGTDDKSVAPGIGMRLTVAGICQKFPSVKNVSTGQLSTWMKQTESQSQSQSGTEETKQAAAGDLVILV